MAPVEALERPSNALTLAYLAGVSLVGVGCLFTILRSLLTVRRSLPVSQRTRGHEARRRGDVLLFSGLALLCVAVQVYNLVETLVDSYTNYVVAHRVSPDLDVWTSFLWYPRKDQYSTTQLTSWWSSGELERSLVALGSSPRDFWWFQQHQVATAIWTTFLGIEGHRRNIPHLWAFIPLVTVFGLSLAQNLFFISLLLTPVPFKRSAAARKREARSAGWVSRTLTRLHLRPSTTRSAAWTPDAELYLMPLVLSMFCVAALPYITDELYSHLTTVDRQMLWFAPLIVSHTGLIPKWMGTTHPNIHSAHASSRLIYRTAALFAVVLHGVSTYSAIVNNTPAAPHTRFRFFLPDEPVLDSVVSRYGHGIGKILGAFSDSPLVQLVGWDVVLSGLSLCAWAATRGLGASAVLPIFGIPVAPSEPRPAEPSTVPSSAIGKAGSQIAKRASSASRQVKEKLTPARRSPSSPTTTTTVTNSAYMSLRNRNVGHDSTSTVTTNGDVDDDDVDEEEEEDATYKPTAAVAAEERGIDHDEHQEPVDAEEAAESFSLAWAALVITGLGGGMAGICGGEAA